MSDTTCPVLRPTAEEFRDFRSYLRTLDKYHSAGIVKVIPPKECVFKRDYDPAHLDMELSHYYEQASRRIENDGGKGIYDIQLKWREAPISLAEFKDLLDTSEDIPNVRGDDNAQKKVWAKRESKFWRLMGDKSAPVPKYAGDVNVSLFGNDAAHSWNLNRLDSLLQTVGQHYGGVTDSMCYVGQYRAMFACHVEDMDLYSINYLHTGLPKSWYSISTDQKNFFENIAATLYPEEATECPNFLRHKNKMFSHRFLQDNNVRVHTVVQLPGEYVVTMPGAYHFGYNHGYNIAEATNFATPRWFDIGRFATRCVCERGNVYIEPWEIDRMETVWLRQRNFSFTSPVSWPNYRMRCRCQMNDSYDSDKDIWMCRVGRKIFCCVACKLWCHWDCIFGGDEAGSQGAEGEQDEQGPLCHICHNLENSSDPLSIIPVTVDPVTGEIVRVGEDSSDSDQGMGKSNSRKRKSDRERDQSTISRARNLSKAQEKSKGEKGEKDRTAQKPSKIKKSGRPPLDLCFTSDVFDD